MGSLLCTTILLAVLILSGVYHAERYLPVLMASILVTIAGWVLISFLHGRGLSVAIFLVAATLNLFLIVPELTLRAVGFRYESGIQFGYPRPSVFVSYVPDEKLFWRLDSTRPDVNSLGFPGREPEIPKPPDVVRVLFLGDSCTQQGYPRIVELFLRSKCTQDQLRFECISLAVAGYSSHQGRVLAEMYGETLEPDVVVVYFGWNDHWLAYEETDADKVIEVREGRKGGLLDYVYRRSRLIQGFIWIGKSISGARSAPLDEVRVPPGEYRTNLMRIQEIFDGLGVPVIFVTAPTSHYQLGVPDFLVDAHYARDRDSVVAYHRQYNDIVRKVASDNGASLVDLANALGKNSEEDVQTIFSLDGIHLSPEGMAVVARFLADEIEANIEGASDAAGVGDP